MQNRNNDVSGVMLFAKQPGKTSFSSLSTIKKALGTSKVGHTGTLDSFADGLLVVLVGSLTRLVPHITGFDKTYLALVEFGSETDTLDPTGAVIKTAAVPTEEQVRAVLPKFLGDIMQVPPAFSALHVDGERASDLMRRGEAVSLSARPIHIYNLNLLDFEDKYALLEVRCSKGTYIRSLARDVADACGSCAHLKALRRVSVGPFALKDAAGSSALGDFTISALTAGDDAAAGNAAGDSPAFLQEVRAALQPMTASLAEYCGFTPVVLTKNGETAFENGRPLKNSDFAPAGAFSGTPLDMQPGEQLAAFYPADTVCATGAGASGNASAGLFAGVVDVLSDKKSGVRLSYGFVIPRKKRMAVYTWQQVVEQGIDKRFLKSGTALTVGSFDGPHIGHDALFTAVFRACKPKKGFAPLSPGVITFSRSLKSYKEGESYKGDVVSLRQKLEIFEQKGFAFAVVIDFSPSFGKIEAPCFLDTLVRQCGMRFLAEGVDFHCGYKGAFDDEQIALYGKEHGFVLSVCKPVEYEGERVSSSRIRDAVLACRFDSASAMLSRPFAYDCTNLAWKESKENGTSVYTAEVAENQLLPPDGKYTTTVQLLERTYSATCEITSGYLRLLDVTVPLASGVRTIYFGFPRDFIY